MSRLVMPARKPVDGPAGIDRGDGDGEIGITVEHGGQPQRIVMSEYNAWRVFGMLSVFLHIPLPSATGKAIKL